MPRSTNKAVYSTGQTAHLPHVHRTGHFRHGPNASRLVRPQFVDYFFFFLLCLRSFSFFLFDFDIRSGSRASTFNDGPHFDDVIIRKCEISAVIQCAIGSMQYVPPTVMCVVKDSSAGGWGRFYQSFVFFLSKEERKSDHNKVSGCFNVGIDKCIDHA